MTNHNSPRVRRALAVAPVVALGLAALFAETASAGGKNPCFKPCLEIYSTSVAGTATSVGAASVNTKWKRPFIIEGAGAAEGFLDQDAGAVGSRSAAGMSRFYTPTCPGWSYSWSARGTVVGVVRAKAGKATCGSAHAASSFAAAVGGDVNPVARDSKTATNATSGGSGISVNVGGSDTGPSYGLGISTSTQNVSPTTNAAGDANSILGGPNSNVGAGAETLCTVSLYGYLTVQANGGGFSSAPHISKSSASAGGLVGGIVEQELFARDPDGGMYGMGVHAQEGFFRVLEWDPAKLRWTRGVWVPNVGPEFEESGPDEEIVDDPPLPPTPGSREPNDDGWRRF